MTYSRDIIIFSFRYSLGRMSMAPYSFTSWCKENIDDISRGDINLMIKEIDEAELDKDLGMDCDIATWINFRHFLTIEDEKRFEKEKRWKDY